MRTSAIQSWAAALVFVGVAAAGTGAASAQDSPLGATELANLQAQCSFAQLLGSGFGVCSCGGVVE